MFARSRLVQLRPPLQLQTRNPLGLSSASGVTAATAAALRKPAPAAVRGNVPIARSFASSANTKASSSSSSRFRFGLSRVSGLVLGGVMLVSGAGLTIALAQAAPNDGNEKEACGCHKDGGGHHDSGNASLQHVASSHGETAIDGPDGALGWEGWLPANQQPSSTKHPSNRANVSPLSLSSIAAAQASMMLFEPPDAHAGQAVAQRGVGQAIMTLSHPGAALELAEHALGNLPIEEAVLTRAPKVPPPIRRSHPVLLKVFLETTTKVMQLTNRLKYEFWTFNDVVPGPMIRARVGDVVELTLKNTDQTGNPHNIDCHGFEGPGGGAPITTAQQDESKTARFKLLYPGLYIYHCAAAPVPAHIMNGMYGMMLVEPEYSTLPPVDREYYVLQSEFYTEPLDSTGGNQVVEPSYPRGLDEQADIVVFNGKEGALTTDQPLQAKTGEHVRIYFGNAGPNLCSSFHVIGGIFEKVWRDGDLVSPPGRFIQTVLVPPGGSSVLDIHPVVPGTYTLVDHAIFRLDKGAVGYLNVTGKDRPDIYSGGIPQPCPGCKLHP